MESRWCKHTASCKLGAVYGLLSHHKLVHPLPKLNILNVVPWLGNARKSITRARFAMSIRSPRMLPLRSTRKMYSCAAIVGSLNCGTTVSCIAREPDGPRSAKQRAASRPSALMDNTKSCERKVAER